MSLSVLTVFLADADRFGRLDFDLDAGGGSDQDLGLRTPGNSLSFESDKCRLRNVTVRLHRSK